MAAEILTTGEEFDGNGWPENEGEVVVCFAGIAGCKREPHETITICTETVERKKKKGGTHQSFNYHVTAVYRRGKDCTSEAVPVAGIDATCRNLWNNQPPPNNRELDK